jgi:AraC-like DNA-binding protein
MSYREFTPPADLLPHVACLWARTDVPTRVLPDGCADIVWTGSGLIVAGPATRATLPRLAPGEPILGVRFRVGAAGVALGLPAAELLNRSPTLGEVWADGDELAQRVGEATDARARLGLLAGLVVRRLARAPAPDPLLRAAILELARPRARIAGLSERLSISERQLRRRFTDAVGYPPKTLARVLRLQRFLAMSAQGEELARVAADAGYADQPHLTRECIALAGLPTRALLAAGAGPAGERLTQA